jgi:3-methyl-2-oxobutanoate hydroxymethyltransferase
MSTGYHKPQTVTLKTLNRYKQQGQKFAMLTAYDASFARLANDNGVEVLLVGDTLGNVIQGQATTVSVTMDHMIYHTRWVAQGNQGALVIADLPFMSYSRTEQALNNASRLMQAGAQMVKMEGGAWLAETIIQLKRGGIPVCAHLGLTPQSIHALGGYQVQGRQPAQAQQLIEDSQALAAAGAALLVLECVPGKLAAKITELLDIPVIGIGAGAATDGQVLVLYDLLGISLGYTPKFAKNFLAEAGGDISTAISHYVAAVKTGTFPAAEHIFD